jgi:hypothetical protein
MIMVLVEGVHICQRLLRCQALRKRRRGGQSNCMRSQGKQHGRHDAVG